MAIDVSGLRAVVTGGANGIGLAAAKALAAGGADVWIFDLEKEQPEQVAASLGVHGLPVDVTSPASLETGFQRAGEVDIVVANAGTAQEAELLDTTPEIWERLLRVNLTGAFFTVQAAARHMLSRRRGAIVLTASTNSFDGEARLVAYNATKSGLLGILHTAANELGPYGIRVNAVCPGLVRTRLTTGLFADDEAARAYFRQIPLGRGAETEEIAHAIAFLASGYASYITGATLLVDGGQMAGKYGTWNEQRAEFADSRWRLKPNP